MVALSNILSAAPFAIPVGIGSINSSIHFMQLPILVSGILLGPWIGLLTGVLGGLYMSYSTGIPFIVGGLAIFGFVSGFLTYKVKVKPIFSGILAWVIQAPYVFFTDYIWFIYARSMPSIVALTTVSIILVILTVEAIIASGLAGIIVSFMVRHGIK
jgi:LytS/YehU family sensor histidine kinase